MKIVRYRLDDLEYYGVLENGEIFRVDGDIFSSYTASDSPVEVERAVLLPPVSPGKIIGMGINYYDFVESVKMPVPERPYIFHKPVSTLIGPDEPVLLPNESDLISFEGELALVIGRKAKNVPEQDVGKYIFAITCANDITNKSDFTRDGHLGIAKSYDTFCPVGPCLVAGYPEEKLNVQCFLNGERKQHGYTDNMIFSIPKMVSFISAFMTLYPGDLILTGTPAGPETLKNGDRVDVKIDPIGTLSNPVQL